MGHTDGIEEKYRIAFTVIPVFNGVFKVVFNSKLLPGEYAFFPAAKITRAIFPKVYDFTIQ